jgi:hypothetical protein
MNALVPIALFGWIPIALALFRGRANHRTVIFLFVLASLFLPVVYEPVLGLNWTKVRATSYGILLAILIFDARRLFAVRLSWLDLPMAVWCVSPLFSSLANDLGLYDGFSQSLQQFVVWGVPYWIGRAYFTDMRTLRDLALGIVLGGLLYVPFCIVEVRLSPQWHTWIYGYFQHDFSQVLRFGGWRPVVFMEHGLAVGFWMAAATLISGWMWHSGDLPEFTLGPFSLRPAYTVGILAVTTLLCKSSGAIGLGAVGAAILYLSVKFRTRLLLGGLLSAPALYVYLRIWGGWTGMELADAIGQYFDRERSASVIFRLENENLLINRAMESPVFGWGGWGRSRVFDEDGRDVTVTDGLWIIAFGDRGFVGLAALGAALAVPAIRVLRRFPPNLWAKAPYGVAAVLAVNLGLFFVDGIANAMLNPVFILSAGGMIGLAGSTQPASTAVSSATCSYPPKRGVRKFSARPVAGALP